MNNSSSDKPDHEYENCPCGGRRIKGHVPSAEGNEARRQAILDCAQMVNGRLAGRQEGSDLWLEIIKITRMLERFSRGDVGLGHTPSATRNEVKP